MPAPGSTLRPRPEGTDLEGLCDANADADLRETSSIRQVLCPGRIPSPTQELLRIQGQRDKKTKKTKMQLKRERMGQRFKNKQNVRRAAPRTSVFGVGGGGAASLGGSEKWRLRGFREATLKSCTALT